MDKYIRALISIFDRYNFHTSKHDNLFRRIELETSFDAVIEVAIHDNKTTPENIEYLQNYACDLLRRYSV